MTFRRPALLEARAGGLRIVHRPELRPEWALQAIALHRENAARGREYCEHWGPGSSVSRVVLRRGALDHHGERELDHRGERELDHRGERELDLAVKWNHARGLRGSVSDTLNGSRAARAVAGANQLAPLGLGHPETLAFAEERRLGLLTESYLITRFLADAEPLPIALGAARAQPARRRAIVRSVGEAIGTLHAAGLDHADLKHSNLLVRSGGEVVLLDLDTLVPPRRPTWRRVVRALGQLEAYATDLYPWLPRTDRARFLRAYFQQAPALAARRRALVAEVRGWVLERLQRWEGRDRELHIYYPLAPRATRPCTVVPAAGTERPGPRFVRQPGS